MMTGLAVLAGAALLGAGVYWQIARSVKRRDALQELARELGFAFTDQAPGLDAEDYRSLRIFSLGRNRVYENVLSGTAEGTAGLVVCDYRYTTGDGRSARTHRQTVALLGYPKGGLPRFELRPESLLHKMSSVFGYQDIDFPEHPDFSAKYLLRGPDEAAVRALFGLNLIQYFEAHPGWCVDGRGRWLAAYRHGRLEDPARLRDFIDEAKVLLWAFPR